MADQGKSSSSSTNNTSSSTSSGKSARKPAAAEALPWPSLLPMGHHQSKPAIPLMRPVMLVGSRHNAHLHLVSRHVSKAHALFLCYDNKVYVRDLASRTHVYVNGLEVREADLADGDLIKIGSFTFKYQATDGASERGKSSAAPAAMLAIEGAEAPLSVDGRVMLIGRRPTCDISLVEESVSTAHAVIFSMGRRRYIRDLGSRTGTFVNGQAGKQAELHLGDVIRIGETTLNYQPASGRMIHAGEAAASGSEQEPALDAPAPETASDGQHTFVSQYLGKERLSGSGADDAMHHAAREAVARAERGEASDVPPPIQTDSIPEVTVEETPEVASQAAPQELAPEPLPLAPIEEPLSGEALKEAPGAAVDIGLPPASKEITVEVPKEPVKEGRRRGWLGFGRRRGSEAPAVPIELAPVEPVESEVDAQNAEPSDAPAGSESQAEKEFLAMLDAQAAELDAAGETHEKGAADTEGDAGAVASAEAAGDVPEVLATSLPQAEAELQEEFVVGTAESLESAAPFSVSSTPAVEHPLEEEAPIPLAVEEEAEQPEAVEEQPQAIAPPEEQVVEVPVEPVVGEEISEGSAPAPVEVEASTEVVEPSLASGIESAIEPVESAQAPIPISNEPIAPSAADLSAPATEAGAEPIELAPASSPKRREGRRKKPQRVPPTVIGDTNPQEAPVEAEAGPIGAELVSAPREQQIASEPAPIGLAPEDAHEGIEPSAQPPVSFATPIDLPVAAEAIAPPVIERELAEPAAAENSGDAQAAEAAPVEGDVQPPAVVEVLDATEPTPDAALTLDSLVADTGGLGVAASDSVEGSRADSRPVEPVDQADASPAQGGDVVDAASLSDTNFGRILDEFSGPSTGPLLETPQEIPAASEEISDEVSQPDEALPVAQDVSLPPAQPESAPVETSAAAPAADDADEDLLLGDEENITPENDLSSAVVQDVTADNTPQPMTVDLSDQDTQLSSVAVALQSPELGVEGVVQPNQPLSPGEEFFTTSQVEAVASLGDVSPVEAPVMAAEPHATDAAASQEVAPREVAPQEVAPQETAPQAFVPSDQDSLLDSDEDPPGLLLPPQFDADPSQDGADAGQQLGMGLSYFDMGAAGFLGGMPLHLNELPAPPPTFGQVSVHFPSEGSNRAAQDDAAQDSTAEGEQSGSPAELGPFERLRVTEQDVAEPTTPEIDPQELLNRPSLGQSRLFLPKRPVPPPPPRVRQVRPVSSTQALIHEAMRGVPAENGENSAAAPSGESPAIGADSMPTPGEPVSGSANTSNLRNDAARMATVFGGLTAAVRHTDIFSGFPTVPTEDEAAGIAPIEGSDAAQESLPSQSGATVPAMPQDASTISPEQSPSSEVTLSADANLTADLDAMPSEGSLEGQFGEVGDAAGQGTEAAENSADHEVEQELEREVAQAGPVFGDTEVRKKVAEQATGSEAVARSPVPPAMSEMPTVPYSPFLLPPRRSAHFGVLLVLMILLAGAAVSAIYVLPILRPQNLSENGITFENVNQVRPGRLKIFQDDQLAQLNSEQMMAGAAKILHQQPETRNLSAGFLSDPELRGSKTFLTYWATDLPGRLVVKYTGTDRNDPARIDALLRAMVKTDEVLVKQAADNQRIMQTLTQGIADTEAKLTAKRQQRDAATALVSQMPTAAELTALQAAADNLHDVWQKAVDVSRSAEQRVKSAEDQVNALTPAASTTAPAGVAAGPTTGPVALHPSTSGNVSEANDAQLRQLNTTLSDVNQQIAAAQNAAADQTDQARRTLDQTLKQVEQLQEDIQKMAKDSPELQAYVQAAQHLMDATRQYTGQLLDQQQKQHDRLQEMKHRLDEQMEARRQDLWGNDDQLKQLMGDLAFRERAYHAAQEQGYMKEAAQILHEMELAKQKIESRKTELGNDVVLEGISRQLEDEIGASQKQLEVDRQQSDQLIKEMEANFAQNSALIGKLPDAQRALATRLGDQIAAMDKARTNYASAVAARTGDDNEHLKALKAQVKSLTSQISDRQKQLALLGNLDSNKTVTPQQREQLAASLESARAELTKAKSAEASAETAYLAKQDELRQRHNDEAKGRQARDSVEPLVQEIKTLESQLQLYNNDKQTRTENATVDVYPRPPEKAASFIAGRDDRPVYAASSTAGIAIFFALLMMLSAHRAHKSNARFAEALASLSAAPHDQQQPVAVDEDHPHELAVEDVDAPHAEEPAAGNGEALDEAYEHAFDGRVDPLADTTFGEPVVEESNGNGHVHEHQHVHQSDNGDGLHASGNGDGSVAGEQEISSGLLHESQSHINSESDSEPDSEPAEIL